ncbi:MAG: type II toxin-antitoxin system VapC family toxin [Verrucomicrobiae bacterium]|nr:type II toxin-antitoxin system VapC family toxin [Verrucomicrobiae bacterium]
MSASHLLDTCVYCQPIRRHPLESVMRWMDAIGDRHMAISVICEVEILFGINRLHGGQLRHVYECLLKDRFPILTIDQRVAVTAAEIKFKRESRGQPMAPFDLLIAATAKTHRLILATLNAKHFAGIEGLAVEDWSVFSRMAQ